MALISRTEIVETTPTTTTIVEDTGDSNTGFIVGVIFAVLVLVAAIVYFHPWETIQSSSTTVISVPGQPGPAGKDGSNGANGANGANGVNAAPAAPPVQAAPAAPADPAAPVPAAT